MLLWLGAALASYLFAFLPAWQGLVKAWNASEEASHGFLIVPVSLYLVWAGRHALCETDLRPRNWGLAFVVVSLLLYIFAHFAEIASVEYVSCILAIPGVVVYLWGCGTLKRLAFPIAFLVFMIPVPAQIYASITLPLQLLVTRASVWFAGLVGVPIHREGNVIQLANQTLQVVNACSGLRSMVSLAAIGALVGYTTLRSNALRIALLGTSVPVAVLVNIVRVTVLVFAWHFWGVDLIRGESHLVFGVGIFALALVLLLGIGAAFRGLDRP